MLNIGSLVLGVGAWGMAVFAITTQKVHIFHRSTVLSFSLCGISLVFQMLELYRRVCLGDYAAIEDTIRAVLIASMVLVGGTITMNVAALCKGKSK